MNKLEEKDAIRLQKLMAKIIKESEFKLSINAFVDLFNEFDWVNKILVPKIKDNIFQVEKVTIPPSTKEEVKLKKTRTSRVSK